MSNSAVVRKYYRAMDWMLSDAENGQTTHRYVCLSADENGTRCGAAGSIRSTAKAAQRWVFRHAQKHPDHQTYAYAPVTPCVISPKGEQ